MRAKHAGGDHDRADGEPVEPVGQVDRVGGADHDEGGERQEEPAEMDQQFLEERHREAVVQRGGRQLHDGEGGDEADGDLGRAACSRPGRPLRVAPGQLQVIVDEADGAEADGHEQHDPDEAVAQIGPEQRAER